MNLKVLLNTLHSIRGYYVLELSFVWGGSYHPEAQCYPSCFWMFPPLLSIHIILFFVLFYFVLWLFPFSVPHCLLDAQYPFGFMKTFPTGIRLVCCFLHFKLSSANNLMILSANDYPPYVSGVWILFGGNQKDLMACAHCSSLNQ